MLWSLMLISLIAHCNAHTVKELTGKTSQSSDYYGEGIVHSSERAMDGNESACSHTEKQINSWWRIDLLGFYRINSISIFNTQSTCSINGTQIYIGNSRENNGTTNRLCKNITNFKNGELNDFDFDKNVSGRYITVFFPVDCHLILCEVKINGTKMDQEENNKIIYSPFQLIKENKTWEDALDYCRDQHMDLASIVDAKTQTWAELQAINSSTRFVWLGLRYTCTLEFWFWVEDLAVKFSRWGPRCRIDDCNTSGAMDKQEDYLWFSKPTNEKFNFICTK